MVVVLLSATSWAYATRNYSRVVSYNAVPSGSKSTVKSETACAQACDATTGCLQWSFNTKSHHCFVSSSKTWGGSANDRVVSGCIRPDVDGCPDPSKPLPRMPFWGTHKPDGSALQGYKKYRNATDSAIYLPQSDKDGWYNHGAMITYYKGSIIVSWKNAPKKEDTPGQRVLYSTSSDGVHWTSAAVLFPNMSTSATPSAQFAGPFAVLNGRLYASATPSIISDGDAQGAQFCLWPDGLDPRNCATPDRPGSQPPGLLMMRRVNADSLGDAFWVYTPPAAYKQAAAANGVKLLADMDDETQKDVAELVGGGASDGFQTPCDNGKDSGTLKCEACKGGCQVYSSPGTVGHGIANERAHYRVPKSKADVILFRSHSDTLWASVRLDGDTQANWSAIAQTTIPNDNSNLNAGELPDGRGVFVVSNTAPAKLRDPLTVSVSADGYNFTSCNVVQTCTDILDGKASTCLARQPGNRNKGPSYPQALSVIEPASASVQGLYVVATNNKEDVIITRVPWDVVLEDLSGSSVVVV